MNDLRLTIVNPFVDAHLRDPDETLDTYTTLTNWSRAMLEAGASRVEVVQLFGRDACILRDKVTYHFVGAAGPGHGTDSEARLADAVAGCQADVVHINGLAFGRVARAVRRTCTGPPIVMQHHGENCPRHRWRVLGTRRALSYADAVFIAARELADPWVRAGVFTPRHLVFEVMEASTRLRRVEVETGHRPARLVGEPAVLWVGRLEPVKDPLCVLDGFAGALPSLPRAHLTFVYQRESLLHDIEQRLAADPQLSKHVTLHGFSPPEDLAALYSDADIFITGSHREGSGYALMEAMACGALPVVTDIPSFRVLTHGGVVGQLWAAGSPGACASALVAGAACVGAAQRQQMTRHFDTYWSWEAIGRAAMQAYFSMLHSRRGMLAGSTTTPH